MTRLIKVLVRASGDKRSRVGGGLLAIQDKILQLERLGVDVTIDLKNQQSPELYDLIHIQHTIHDVYEVYQQVLEAIKWRKPIVLKPFYNPIRDIDNYLRMGQTYFVRMVYKLLNNINSYLKLRGIFYSLNDRNYLTVIKKIFSDYHKQQIAILKNSFLIPDSYFELKYLEQEARITIKNFKIVHASACINDDLKNTSTSIFFNKYRITDFVLCAGRIEPLKNQVKLINALSKCTLNIVIAGTLVTTHKAYTKEFLNLVENTSNVYWIGPLSREMLYSAYKNAHVVVIPSWTETAGMTGLEGGYFDCNIAVTERGGCREYFKENAWYMDPGNLESIRQAVLDAFHSPKGERSFKERIMREFSLEKTSEDLYDAYIKAIENYNKN